MVYKLKAQARELGTQGEINKVRQQGLVPVVLYGRGLENLTVLVDRNELTKLEDEAGESSLIEITVEGQPQPFNVLIKEIQKDPVTDNIIHADLQRIRMDEEVTAEVKLVFVGEAPAVKEMGGNLVKARDTITIKCLPADLISSIEVDLSSLVDYDANIHISDLSISDKVQVLDDIHSSVASVVAPTVEKVEEAVAPVVEGAEGEVKEGETADGDKAGESKGETKSEGNK